MRTLKIFALVSAFGLLSFSSLNAISWKSETIEMGEIQQGTPKKIEFEFKNTSGKVVLISNVVGSCGCTATDYTKTPIAPKGTGTVTATYNAANLGQFSKTVSVTTSADSNPKILTLKGTVVAVATKS